LIFQPFAVAHRLSVRHGTQSRHMPESSVSRDQRQTMPQRETGNPEIIFA
jgi:hypothetical protein